MPPIRHHKPPPCIKINAGRTPFVFTGRYTFTGIANPSGDVLAIKTKYIGIKQRQDRMMSINFNVSPPQMKEIEGFFEGTNDFDTLYYDISQTGSIPINFRGMSSVTRNVGADNDTIFSLYILLEPVKSPSRGAQRGSTRR